MGRVLIETLVQPVVIEMELVLVENGVGVSLVVDQQPVGALLADAADEPLSIAIRAWGPGRDLDHVDALGDEDGIESSTELAVSIADQEAERGDPFT
jgi:hypothetical protein